MNWAGQIFCCSLEREWWVFVGVFLFVCFWAGMKLGRTESYGRVKFIVGLYFGLTLQIGVEWLGQCYVYVKFYYWTLDRYSEETGLGVLDKCLVHVAVLFKQSVCRLYLGRGWLSLNLAMNKVEEDSQSYHSRAASVEMGRTDAGWKICSNIFKLFFTKFLAYDFSGALKNSRYNCRQWG